VPFSRRVLPKRSDGKRPPDMTNEIIRALLVNIAVGGAYEGVAARSVGVPPETFSRWMHRKGEPYETLQKWVREAQARYEMALQNSANEGAKTDPKIATALLERRFPERWARVVAQPGTPVNLSFSVTNVLQKIEERARTIHDPRPPRPGQVSLVEVIDRARGELKPAPSDDILDAEVTE
jgi:hypothetical protein